MSDFAAARELGVRFQCGEEDNAYHNRVLPEFAQLAAEGTFTVPVARTFPMEAWRAAAELSLSGKTRGELLLQIG